MTTCSTVQIDSMPTSSAVRARCARGSGKPKGPALAYAMPNFMAGSDSRERAPPQGGWPGRRISRVGAALLTRDVVLELLDHELLLRDDGLDDVADRDHAHQPFLLHHGQVADALVGHQRHAVFDRLLGTDVENVGAHDLPDGDLLGGLPFEDDLPRVVPL